MGYILLHPTLQVRFRQAPTSLLVCAFRAPETEEIVFDDGFAFACSKPEDQISMRSIDGNNKTDKRLENVLIIEHRIK